MQRTFAIVALAGLTAVIVWTLAFTGEGDDAAAPQADRAQRVDPGRSTAVEAPPVLAAAAEPLVDLDGWLQTDIDSLDDLRGKVVIVQFWTFACRNCKNTLPYLQALYTEHSDDGFEIVGVHSPEFAFEEDPDAVAAAATDLGVTWPIALDTRQRNFFGWQGSRGYWPRTYVLDGDGRVRFDHIGEGAYDELAATVQYLLDEAA